MKIFLLLTFWQAAMVPQAIWQTKPVEHWSCAPGYVVTNPDDHTCSTRPKLLQKRMGVDLEKEEVIHWKWTVTTGKDGKVHLKFPSEITKPRCDIEPDFKGKPGQVVNLVCHGVIKRDPTAVYGAQYSPPNAPTERGIMQTMDWFSSHPHLYMILVLIGYYFVSAFTERLPAPTDKSGALYKALYTGLEAFTANLKQATTGVRALMPKEGAFKPTEPAPGAPPAAGPPPGDKPPQMRK